jgi:hypothetical protein
VAGVVRTSLIFLRAFLAHLVISGARSAPHATATTGGFSTISILVSVPYSPYSAECVEGVFSEVRSALVLSLAPNFAAGHFLVGDEG